MPVGVILALAVGGVVLVGIVLAIYWRSAAKQKAAAASAAQELGFEEIPDAKQNMAHWMGCGLTGGAKNITSGYRAPRLSDTDREIVLLQHRYVVSSGNSTHVVENRIAITPIPQHWPTVSVKRENMFTRLFAWFGFRGVEVEDQHFNEKWRVKSKNREFAELMLTPEVQSILGNCTRPGWWSVELGFLSYLEKGKLRAEDFSELPAILCQVADAIPPELEYWQESN